jgi:hypothetical protein
MMTMGSDALKKADAVRVCEKCQGEELKNLRSTIQIGFFE